MDNIDITSSEFSLGGFPDLKNIMSSDTTGNNGESLDYTMYIYIAIAILLLIIAFLVYKFYINKQKQVTFQDNQNICYDNVCHS